MIGIIANVERCFVYYSEVIVSVKDFLEQVD